MHYSVWDGETDFIDSLNNAAQAINAIEPKFIWTKNTTTNNNGVREREKKTKWFEICSYVCYADFFGFSTIYRKDYIHDMFSPPPLSLFLFLFTFSLSLFRLISITLWWFESNMLRVFPELKQKQVACYQHGPIRFSVKDCSMSM